MLCIGHCGHCHQDVSYKIDLIEDFNFFRPPDPINFLAGYLLKHKTQYEQSTGVSPAAGQ
jgi:Dpy-30 motif.